MTANEIDRIIADFTERLNNDLTNAMELLRTCLEDYPEDDITTDFPITLRSPITIGNRTFTIRTTYTLTEKAQ